MIYCLLGDSNRTTASLESQTKKTASRRANQVPKEEGFMTVNSQCRQSRTYLSASIAVAAGFALAGSCLVFADDKHDTTRARICASARCPPSPIWLAAATS